MGLGDFLKGLDPFSQGFGTAVNGFGNSVFGGGSMTNPSTYDYSPYPPGAFGKDPPPIVGSASNNFFGIDPAKSAQLVGASRPFDSRSIDGGGGNAPGAAPTIPVAGQPPKASPAPIYGFFSGGQGQGGPFGQHWSQGNGNTFATTNIQNPLSQPGWQTLGTDLFFNPNGTGQAPNTSGMRTLGSAAPQAAPVAAPPPPTAPTLPVATGGIPKVQYPTFGQQGGFNSASIDGGGGNVSQTLPYYAAPNSGGGNTSMQQWAPARPSAWGTGDQATWRR